MSLAALPQPLHTISWNFFNIYLIRYSVVPLYMLCYAPHFSVIGDVQRHYTPTTSMYLFIGKMDCCEWKNGPWWWIPELNSCEQVHRLVKFLRVREKNLQFSIFLFKSRILKNITVQKWRDENCSFIMKKTSGVIKATQKVAAQIILIDI